MNPLVFGFEWCAVIYQSIVVCEKGKGERKEVRKGKRNVCIESKRKKRALKTEQKTWKERHQTHCCVELNDDFFSELLIFFSSTPSSFWLNIDRGWDYFRIISQKNLFEKRKWRRKWENKLIKLHWIKMWKGPFLMWLYSGTA